MHEQREKFNKPVETIKQTEILELKNTVTDLNNSIESFKIRLDHTEERIKDLEHETFEIIRRKDQK